MHGTALRRPALTLAVLALLAVAVGVALYAATHHGDLQPLASIVGDPHQCQGPNPGPGCGN